MTAMAQHIRLRLKDDREIAPTVQERRVVARSVLTVARRFGLLVFGLADTHLHLLVACALALAMQLARRIEVSLHHRLALDVGFASAYAEPIRDNKHLYNTLDYILGQSRRHNLSWDPLREATNLPDLLGTRLVGSYTRANVRQHLPRITVDRLLGHLGLTSLKPADGPVERVLEATLAATALSDLSGNSAEVVAARRAMLHLLGEQVPTRTLADMLHLAPRSVNRLRNEGADQQLVEAIRLQLGLRKALGSVPPGEAPYLADHPQAW
ncbi:MAG: hypothetical protein JW797_15175 [Bradymonadales bacterium]|nr:hypothetical protein [Bradymonadales bacterium]